MRLRACAREGFITFSLSSTHSVRVPRGDQSPLLLCQRGHEAWRIIYIKGLWKLSSAQQVAAPSYPFQDPLCLPRPGQPLVQGNSLHPSSDARPLPQARGQGRAAQVPQASGPCAAARASRSAPGGRREAWECAAKGRRSPGARRRARSGPEKWKEPGGWRWGDNTGKARTPK